MIQVARRPLSLETPTDDEEDSVLGDFIEDDEAPPPDDTATYNLLREHLGEVLNSLPPREVRILQLRYGLLDGQAYTLEEVGRKMGVTRETCPPNRSTGIKPIASSFHSTQTARLSRRIDNKKATSKRCRFFYSSTKIVKRAK